MSQRSDRDGLPRFARNDAKLTKLHFACNGAKLTMLLFARNDAKLTMLHLACNDAGHDNASHEAARPFVMARSEATWPSMSVDRFEDVVQRVCMQGSHGVCTVIQYRALVDGALVGDLALVDGGRL
mgnify:CR=1 FL=1